jgi:hypothetical protein
MIKTVKVTPSDNDINRGFSMKHMVIMLFGIVVLALPLSSYGDPVKSSHKEMVERLERPLETSKKNLQKAERGKAVDDGLQETTSGGMVQRSKAKAKQKEQPEDDYLMTIQRKSSESDKKKLRY